MDLKKIVDKVKEEVKVLKGDETKDKTYTNKNEYPDADTARHHFELARQKLFDVNGWNNLKGLTSTFTLYDRQGNKSDKKKPETGYFIGIVLPATTIDNWVEVTDIREEENIAEFVVHPSKKPDRQAEAGEDKAAVKHFFVKEASSTFRVELQGNTLIGSEIGKNEGINNKGEDAGDRPMLNTLVAEGGWAQVQKIQWDKLTSYLVHLQDNGDAS
ncbi:hypothetical protein I2I11_10495 [Pontibacter sp. 172403-2]|uniref:hypothetical protein n=1 Tax=Pontibacter rufus TaxID=2791028 RepID=UPI0018B00AB4|nr:hypothetical protein [Pontibacter sp. 172403-2]MBF9253722.1 hypothetical protein [Pontibacter sp. 172403-2]